MKHGMPHHPGEHRHDNVKAHKEPQHGAHHLKEGVDHLHAHHAQIEIEVKREGEHKRRDFGRVEHQWDAADFCSGAERRNRHS
jgi:hypothetical protein